jgi:hypothetical protein
MVSLLIVSPLNTEAGNDVIGQFIMATSCTLVNCENALAAKENVEIPDLHFMVTVIGKSGLKLDVEAPENPVK